MMHKCLSSVLRGQIDQIVNDLMYSPGSFAIESTGKDFLRYRWRTRNGFIKTLRRSSSSVGPNEIFVTIFQTLLISQNGGCFL